MFCAGPVEEQIKPASEGTSSMPDCSRHVPAALRLILVLLVNTHHQITSFREEGGEAALPCLSPDLGPGLAWAGSDCAPAE